VAVAEATITETEIRIANGVAKRVHRTQRFLLEFDDIRSEMYLWMAAHQDKMSRWREEGKSGKGKLGTALYRAGMRWATKERARITRTHVSDHAFYSEAVLHELLPDVYDYDNWILNTVEDDTDGRMQSRPGEGNTRLAMLVDVKFALESLPEDDQELLQARFADGGMDVQVLAATYQAHESTIRRRVRNALRRLSDKLGGEPPWM
jgi:DNA-directed RNA polymerase specialized sigma24 family protein